MLGRNLIENLTVLRFSNLVFEPLWNRTYIRNVQVVSKRFSLSHSELFTLSTNDTCRLLYQNQLRKQQSKA